MKQYHISKQLRNTPSYASLTFWASSWQYPYLTNHTLPVDSTPILQITHPVDSTPILQIILFKTTVPLSYKSPIQSTVPLSYKSYSSSRQYPYLTNHSSSQQYTYLTILVLPIKNILNHLSSSLSPPYFMVTAESRGNLNYVALCYQQEFTPWFKKVWQKQPVGYTPSPQLQCHMSNLMSFIVSLSVEAFPT